jgi:hypothetical protein
VVFGASALAQQTSPAASPAPGTPPSWETLVRCAGMADQDARLSCYDAAMRAAGYSPKPAEVAAEKRKRFGLSFPKIGAIKKEARQEGAQAAAPAGAPAPSEPAKTEEDEGRVTVTLDDVAILQPSKHLLLFTTDGAIWAQTDNETVAPLPKSGQTITIRRNAFGGYFCQFDKRTAVRCERKR